MKLLERETYLKTFNELYQSIEDKGGQSLFIFGEAGIGKTSLVRTFSQKIADHTLIYTGTCDSLITPRPLGPLYDIASQLSAKIQEKLKLEKDRSVLFISFLEELKQKNQPIILIIEDIHWADEATLDFIKFLARRIDQVCCLFVLTYRDDEIGPDHPVRTIYGEIPAHSSTKIKLNRLSLDSVRELSKGTEYNPEAVYKLTEGNPFYVSEILAWYSPGIPDNIKDSVLSVFYKQNDEVRKLWELISVFPARINVKLLQLIRPDFDKILDKCLDSGVLRIEGQYLLFKHEIYRKTIEEALNPIRRIQLNEKVLKVLLENKDDVDLVMLVHHATKSQNDQVVTKYAPLAAQRAAMRGSHIEAANLYKMAIEYSDLDDDELALLYENHSYECYLTNQTKIAIEAQQQALEIWQRLGDKIKIGSSLRILSRLNWFEGHKDNAEKFGLEAIKVLENGFPLQERAKAYSNYAQLKMLSGEKEQALHYGKMAVELAVKIDDNEIFCHALNNIGTVKYLYDSEKGEELYQSLDIALKNGYHEHVARAYTNIASISIMIKAYEKGLAALNDGISYCAERDLDSWTYYMLSWKARYHFEKCEWRAAEDIARNLTENPNHPTIVRIGALTILGRLSIRKGNFNGVKYLDEAKDLALATKELQRIVPVTIAFLEYGWIARNKEVADELVKHVLKGLENTFVNRYYEELAYWMNRSGLSCDISKMRDNIYRWEIEGKRKKTLDYWSNLGCRYEYALSLLGGTEKHRNESLLLLDELGAYGTLEFLKSELRSKGIKNIPRGPRESTKSNPAHLTARQIDVLHQLREGLGNAEIAERLFISPKTVDHHITAILSKLNVHSRNKAVREAEKLGIMDIGKPHS